MVELKVVVKIYVGCDEKNSVSYIFRWFCGDVFLFNQSRGAGAFIKRCKPTAHCVLWPNQT
jgi:hypothetical protein